jgi:hypothetical protein
MAHSGNTVVVSNKEETIQGVGVIGILVAAIAIMYFNRWAGA